jgi:hypothetical protein
MLMDSFVIEKDNSDGKVKLSPNNVLVGLTSDMQEIEFWEDRLDRFKQPYITAYTKAYGRVLYCIFTNVRSKGSAFKVL